MRKIVAGLFISLDGVVEAPQNWHFPYFTDEMGAAVQNQIDASDTLLMGRGTYDEFVQFWSANPNVRSIWVSLYTPQIGEVSDEQLRPEDRRRVVSDLMHLRRVFPKLQMPEGMIKVYADPPSNPDECVFALTTTCVSADFKRPISPCQFGGNPDCSNCGCIASAGLGAIARHRLPGGLRVGAIFENSLRVGQKVRQIRARA